MTKESGRFESKESVERIMEKLIPTAVRSFFDREKECYRIVLEVMIDGIQMAVQFMADRPAELFLGDDKSGESTYPLKRLRDFANSRAGKVLQAVTGFGCAAMAGACGAPADADNNSDHGSPEMSGQFGVDESALTGSDIPHFGTPGPVLWSKWDDDAMEITQIDGKDVLVFAGGAVQEDGNEHSSLFYVECGELFDKAEDCLKFGVPQEIKGMPESYNKWWNGVHPYSPKPPDYIEDFFEGTIFQDENGEYKLIAGTWDEKLIGNVSKQDGVMTVSNFELPPVEIGYFSGPVPINGVPHLFHDDSPQMLLNLHTWQEQDSNFSSECSEHPHWSEEPSWIVAQKGKYENGKLICEFVSAESLDALINNVGVKYFKDINKYNATALGAWGGRIWKNVFIYTVLGPKGTKLYYALIQPYCGNGKADEGETFVNCPQDVMPAQDAVTTTADADAGSATGTDTVTGIDLPLVGTDTIDAALAEIAKEAGVAAETGADGQGDDGQGADNQAGTDTNPDITPDTFHPDSSPDTSVSLCDGVEFTGNCDMDCDSPNATFTGTCTAEVIIGGKTANFEIDGKYTLDMIAKAGELFKGSVEVDDNGLGISTIYGGYETTPKGTISGGDGISPGDLDVYKVWCKEGQISVSYNGKEIAVLSAGDEVIYVNGEPMTPVQPDTVQPEGEEDASQPDTGDDIAVSEGDAGSSEDASNPSKDTVQSGEEDAAVQPGKKDTVVQPEPDKKGGGGDGGCSTSPTENPGKESVPYGLFFIGAALGAIRSAWKSGRVRMLTAGTETVGRVTRRRRGR